jgi:hypothetical protein
MPTIVATVGSSSSNSFLTRQRADALADEDVRFAVLWEAETDDDKIDRSIITASRAISLLDFDGLAANAGQALAFPRIGLVALSGFPLDPTTIPIEIERATLVLAAELQSSPTALDGNPVADMGLKRLKADVVELEWKDDLGEVKTFTLPSKILAMIPWIWLKTFSQVPFFRAM